MKVTTLVLEISIPGKLVESNLINGCIQYSSLNISNFISSFIDNRYATSNEITANESGHLQQGPNGTFATKSGSFSYVWKGVTYTINYVADENGFHPNGDHIPKAL